MIITARIPKRRLIALGMAAVFCMAALLAGLALRLPGGTAAASAEVKGIRDDRDRVAYLTELGWQVSGGPQTEELLIPEMTDASYQDYLALQAEQGFDLTRYQGQRVKRYTYEITNYPGGVQGVQATLLVYRNRVIGGQVQAADGSFIQGLAYPNRAAGAGGGRTALA